MSVRILWGNYDGPDVSGACLVDSVTGQAFGPVFDDGDEAEAFLEWLGHLDARKVDMAAKVQEFRRERESEAGEAAWDAHCEAHYGGSSPMTARERAEVDDAG